MTIPDLDNLSDGFYWGQTKHLGVSRMLRKSTDRQTFGQPWKDIEAGKRVTWNEIKDRYAELIEVKQPKKETA